MPLILITGVAGTGKTTVVEVLQARGYAAYDADGMAMWRDRSGRLTEPRDGETFEETTLAGYGWVLPRHLVHAIDQRGRMIFLCGDFDNVDELWDLFDRVFCLVTDERTLVDRLRQRTNNPFGKTPAELEAILGWLSTSAAAYRARGAEIIDSTSPADQVADQILTRVGALRPGP